MEPIARVRPRVLVVKLCVEEMLSEAQTRTESKLVRTLLPEVVMKTGMELDTNSIVEPGPGWEKLTVCVTIKLLGLVNL